MSFKKKTFLNAFQIGSYKYMGEALNFLASMILARLLLPEEYGFVAMILVITNFAMILSGIGIGSDIIRSPYGYTYHKSMMNLSFYIGLGLFVLIFLMSYPIALFYGNNNLIIPSMVISTQFILKGVNTVFFALLMKENKFSLLGQIELAAIVFANIMMISMAYLGFSYWSLIIPFILSDFVKISLYLSNVKIKLKLYKFKYTIIAYRQAKTIIASILGVRMISYWARNLDNMLIGKNFGEASLGIYDRGYKFLNLTGKLFESLFGSVLFPNLQKLKEENGDVFKEYIFFIGVISFMSFPISSILILFPDLLVYVLWGENWMAVAEYLPYFGLIIITTTNTNNTETIFKLFYRDLLLFQLGVFRSIVWVAAILIGITHSPLMVVIMTSAVSIIIIWPVTVFIAYGIKMKFDLVLITKVFLPRIILTSGTFVALLLQMKSLTFIFVGLYFAHLVFIERKDLLRLKEIIKNKILKRK